jgi:hypothetical protein
MQLTLQIPDDLAAELRPREGRLTRILSLGLRELDAQGAAEFAGLADVLELLASLPTPDQIMALRPSQALQDQNFPLQSLPVRLDFISAMISFAVMSRNRDSRSTV